jgi:hypothetical protein
MDGTGGPQPIKSSDAGSRGGSVPEIPHATKIMADSGHVGGGKEGTRHCWATAVGKGR